MNRLDFHGVIVEICEGQPDNCDQATHVRMHQHILDTGGDLAVKTWGFHWGCHGDIICIYIYTYYHIMCIYIYIHNGLTSECWWISNNGNILRISTGQMICGDVQPSNKGDFFTSDDGDTNQQWRWEMGFNGCLIVWGAAILCCSIIEEMMFKHEHWKHVQTNPIWGFHHQ